MTITPAQVYTTTRIRNIAQRGQILLIRSGAVIADYGDGQATELEYGAALNTALSAMVNGDTLNLRGFRAERVGGWTFDIVGGQIIAEDVVLVPKPAYVQGLYVKGSQCLVFGVIVDGLSAANTAVGRGFTVEGDRSHLVNCEAHNVKGNLTTDGIGIVVTGDDCTIDGFYSKGANYAGFKAENSNHLTARNVKIYNPGNRAYTQGGATPLDWMVFENWECLQDVSMVAGDALGAHFNFNHTGKVNTVYMRGIRLTNEDVEGAGISYNTTSSIIQAKLQQIGQLYMDDCVFWHGDNSGSGAAPSWRFEDPASQPPPDEVYMSNCWFSDGFTFNGARTRLISADNCYFGGRQSSAGWLMYSCCGAHLRFTNCTFNIWAGTEVFHASAVAGKWLATDKLEIIDSRFLANTAGTPVVGDGTFKIATGNLLCAGNTFTNTGGGSWARSSHEESELALTTNRNGDMLLDDTILGTGKGKHKTPGAGPSYFTGMAVPANGRRILNNNWSPDLTQVVPEQGWIAHNGVWKEYT